MGVQTYLVPCWQWWPAWFAGAGLALWQELATDSSWSVAASGGSRMRNHGLCKVSVGVLHIYV